MYENVCLRWVNYAAQDLVVSFILSGNVLLMSKIRKLFQTDTLEQFDGKGLHTLGATPRYLSVKVEVF